MTSPTGPDTDTGGTGPKFLRRLAATVAYGVIVLVVEGFKLLPRRRSA